jgi:transcriptional regulator with XRE-family HTH domain
MDMRKVFGQNLRRARLEKGLSQEALALEAEVDRTYISALERGIYSATVTMVGKLADVLGVEPGSLLDRTRWPRGRAS